MVLSPGTSIGTVALSANRTSEARSGTLGLWVDAAEGSNPQRQTRSTAARIGLHRPNATVPSGLVVLRGRASAACALATTDWAAAEKAALADDIRAMPMQMSTIVDPTNVSGGQAQRILLARAIVRNPSIIILDEATSALDNSSQAQIAAALKELKATRIVIAHRLSTIMGADQIVVMEAGVAVEAGTYDELMAKNGAFTALVTRQLA